MGSSAYMDMNTDKTEEGTTAPEVSTADVAASAPETAPEAVPTAATPSEEAPNGGK